MRTLVAIPVYNEQKYVTRVLERVRDFASDILVIDDGSTDDTPMLLAKQPVEVIRHATNRGYSHSLLDAFRWARVDDYDWVITMDCDEQHEPESIPRFLEAELTDSFDIISGSRYLPGSLGEDTPPENRRRINSHITAQLRERLGLPITDAFCGFKAYRVSAIREMDLDVDGYAFPLQFWVQAVKHKLRITEIPVKLIYNDPNRTFGGPLNDDDKRLAHYMDVLESSICRANLPQCRETSVGTFAGA